MALLRGINVGGKTKAAMAALGDTLRLAWLRRRPHLSRAGLGDWAEANYVELADVPF